MLNGNPSLADIDLPSDIDGRVDFWTSHRQYTLLNHRADVWYLFCLEKSTPQMTHTLDVRGSEWVASPIDRGRNVHAPDWRDALRRVVV
ncbi:hypothetical protein [Subtercola boreus]|uniref:Uncharacterized protein n=1 Tax=Subtercola boreus TaxID=120213 RepID=A0A3E0WFA9_9MICO|nr:hypothetical protein [Subtercola boreus]RFA22783.1 hypothetical protein B7R24_04055 [Subtercola boreus]RFA23138.1 hypothetical protein B7R23_04050 [Subtercola boreus]RFA28891.1 hypothetical protein B7R25_04065 [Subtercola boreus]